MKKFICMVIVVSLLLGTFVYAQAADTGNTKVQCNLNSAAIVINSKALNIRTITYKNLIYVPINDIGAYMKTGIKLDEKNKTVNIVTSTATSSSFNPKTRPAKKLNQTINVGINRYKVLVDGLNEYIDSIYYGNTLYVAARYFFEIFDKKVDAKADGKIIITDKKDVVSIVNGEKKPKWEFDYYYNAQVKSIDNTKGTDVKSQKDALKKEVLAYINESAIISQKVKENKIALDDTDIKGIDSSVEQMVKNYGSTEAFRKVLKDNGVYLHQFVLRAKEQNLSGKLARKLVASIAASEDDIKKFYEENKANFTNPETVRAKHILIKTIDSNNAPLDEQKKHEAKAKAEDLLKKINTGENFDELMKSNSEDPGLQSEPNGYTFSRGKMVKEFEDSAFSLKVGEVSGIVETTYGYHIIKLEEKIPSKVRTFEEVKASIKNQLDNTSKQDYLNQVLNKWKSESKIENKI
jgi:parvulin-like peptidyl-prolyl isomerase